MGMKRWDTILARLPQDRELKGAEIGVWEGGLSAILLKERPDLMLFMVDRWAPGPLTPSYRRSRPMVKDRDPEKYKAAYKKAVADTAFATTRAQIWKMESVDAAVLVNDETLDFVFIDGDHSFEAVCADIQAWFPKVRSGGWIGGHDWDEKGRCQVAGAVLQYFYPAQIEQDEDFTWFVKKL